MRKFELHLTETTEKHLDFINSQLPTALEIQELLAACVSFAGFMIMCATEDELFEENLNNVMGTINYKKFFSGENEDVPKSKD